VNAANSYLNGRGRSGRSNSPGRRAFDSQECTGNRSEDRTASAGKAVLTSVGRLTAKYVIHTVGPIYGRGGGEEKRLPVCYRESIRIADDHAIWSAPRCYLAASCTDEPKPQSRFEGKPSDYGVVSDDLNN